MLHSISMQRTFVIGVGMTAFEKPGARDWDYPEMGQEAGKRALVDAGVPYSAVGDASIGYCYGDSTSGQRALYELGLSGIPVVNVNNNCATGSSALHLARRAVRHGVTDCALALGFEKMSRGSLGSHFADRTPPLDKHFAGMVERHGWASAPPAAQLFGNAADEYMARYGTKPEAFAAVAEKNHRHSADNPYSQFREVYTREEILDSPTVFGALTMLQCCPTSDGGAAAVVAGERFVEEHALWDRAVEIVGQGMASDTPDSFAGSDIALVGSGMTRDAARLAYDESGLGAEDAQVVELHDCFSPNEVFSYEALGLCGEGEGAALALDGATTYGGRWVVNPSGGLISKGHPLGATGLAQCAEMVWQLRGTAQARQVDGATVGITQNVGLGGVAVVTVFRKP